MQHRFSMVMAAAACAAGCRTAAPPAADVGIAISPKPPLEQGYGPQACRRLGQLVGKGTETFGGGFIEDKKLVGYALEDLGDKARSMGANYVQHETPQLDTMANGSGGMTTTATVAGIAYLCEGDPGGPRLLRRTPARTDAGAAPVARSKPATETAQVPTDPLESKPPTGAGGLAFGMTADAAREACEAAGHTWEADDTRASCSGTIAGLGMLASVDARFCEAHLCGIDVWAKPDAAGYEGALDALKARLVEKYGPPAHELIDIDEGCADQLATCVVDERASSIAEWQWPSGHKVKLETKARDQQAVIWLGYGTPDRGDADWPGPAL